MAEKRGAQAKRRKINFILEAPDAKTVSLSGSFNNWSVETHPMNSDGKGLWTRSLLLPPGSYEYKFYVDGQWVQDPQNERCCANCFGSSNSVVQVGR